MGSARTAHHNIENPKLHVQSWWCFWSGNCIFSPKIRPCLRGRSAQSQCTKLLCTLQGIDWKSRKTSQSARGCGKRHAISNGIPVQRATGWNRMKGYLKILKEREMEPYASLHHTVTRWYECDVWFIWSARSVPSCTLQVRYEIIWNPTLDTVLSWEAPLPWP